jgi:hypothetical protein
LNRQGLALNLGNAGFDDVSGSIPVGIVPPMPPQVSGELGSVQVPPTSGILAVLTLRFPPGSGSPPLSNFSWTLSHLRREITYYVITSRTTNPPLNISSTTSITCDALASIPEDGIAKRITDTLKDGKPLSGFRYRINGVPIQQTTQLPNLEMGGLQPVILPLPRLENNFAEIIDLW